MLKHCRAPWLAVEKSQCGATSSEQRPIAINNERHVAAISIAERLPSNQPYERSPGSSATQTSLEISAGLQPGRQQRFHYGMKSSTSDSRLASRPAFSRESDADSGISTDLDSSLSITQPSHHEHAQRFVRIPWPHSHKQEAASQLLLAPQSSKPGLRKDKYKSSDAFEKPRKVSFACDNLPQQKQALILDDRAYGSGVCWTDSLASVQVPVRRFPSQVNVGPVIYKPPVLAAPISSNIIPAQIRHNRSRQMHTGARDKHRSTSLPRYYVPAFDKAPDNFAVAISRNGRYDDSRNNSAHEQLNVGRSSCSSIDKNVAGARSDFNIYYAGSRMHEIIPSSAAGPSGVQHQPQKQAPLAKYYYSLPRASSAVAKHPSGAATSANIDRYARVQVKLLQVLQNGTKMLQITKLSDGPFGFFIALASHLHSKGAPQKKLNNFRRFYFENKVIRAESSRGWRSNRRGKWCQTLSRKFTGGCAKANDRKQSFDFTNFAVALLWS